MRKTIIGMCTIFCLLCVNASGYEVRTTPPAAKIGVDRVHYPLAAKRFTDTLMTHPPVHDCHIHLVPGDFNNVIERIEISLDIDRTALTEYLTEVHKLRFVSQKDQDNYLTDLKITLKKSAAEIFTEIKSEAISVSITVIN